MYQIHPDTKTLVAAARHNDFLVEAERERTIAQANQKKVSARFRAQLRWSIPVRVLRGSRPAVDPSPTAA
jgi:hypothetical protein